MLRNVEVRTASDIRFLMLNSNTTAPGRLHRKPCSWQGVDVTWQHEITRKSMSCCFSQIRLLRQIEIQTFIDVRAVPLQARCACDDRRRVLEQMSTTSTVLLATLITLHSSLNAVPRPARAADARRANKKENQWENPARRRATSPTTRAGRWEGATRTAQGHRPNNTCGKEEEWEQEKEDEWENPTGR